MVGVKRRRCIVRIVTEVVLTPAMFEGPTAQKMNLWFPRPEMISVISVTAERFMSLEKAAAVLIAVVATAPTCEGIVSTALTAI